MPFTLPNQSDPHYGRAIGAIEWHDPSSQPVPDVTIFDQPSAVAENPSPDSGYTPPPTARPPLTADQLASRDALHDAWHRPLTNKQRKFVAALFANGFDYTKAAQETDPSLTILKARMIGKTWYELPAIKAAIERAFAYYRENTRVRFEDIVAELRIIAFSNIMDFFEVNANGDPVLSLPPDGDLKLSAIAEINTEDTKFGTKTRLKLYDKLAAMDKLVKLCKFVEDEGGVPSVTVQNIIVTPVPSGQFLPPPEYTAAPLIELRPDLKATQVALKDMRLN